MDNSLSDFEEKKPLAVVKKPEKATTSKSKSKKNLKRIRGQKDIRTALKSKNELISYTNEFDKVCKLTGIDIDTEQLQLAIALSKSLHEKDTNEACTSDSVTCNAQKVSTSQERIGKIRSTLLEYGFKVPEIKIETKKRGKKIRKNYKLLLASHVEKQQIIADKYSEVLLGYINNIKTTESDNCTDCQISSKLYKLATNIAYNYIKSDSTFYIDNLLEPNINTIGSLLRDWSKIPGRPCSPEIKRINFKFTEIDFSEAELDIILSGTFKSVRDVIKDRIVADIDVDIENNQSEFRKEANMEDGVEIISVDDYQRVNEVTNVVDLESPTKLTVTQSIRSYSPDIFDDEVSSVMEQSTNDIEQSQELHRNDTNINNVMDLTECVKATHAKCSQVDSQGILTQIETNATKRKSDDFMEITKCAAVSSQPIRENIDLTQSPDDHIIDTFSNNVNITKETNTVDITSSGEDKDSNTPGGLNIVNDNVANMDLTQSDSNDSLPFVLISGKDKSLDETVVLNKGNDAENVSQTNLLNQTNKEDHNIVENTSIDKENYFKDTEIDRNKTKSNCVSFFEEFIHRHSDERDSNQRHEIALDESSNDTVEYEQIIDVNESSDTRNCKSLCHDTNLNEVDRDEETFSYNKSNVERKHIDENIDLTGTSDDQKTPEMRFKDTDIKDNEEIITFDEEIVSYNKSNDERKHIDENIDLTGTSDDQKTSEMAFKDTDIIDKEIIAFDESSVETEDLQPGDKRNSLAETLNNTDKEIITFDESINETEDNRNIDLTQTSDSTVETKSLHSYNDIDLGKKDDISIDYDEIFDDVVNNATTVENINTIYEINDNDLDHSKEDSNNKIPNTENDCLSQESVFEISDHELDYSMQKSRHEIDNFDIGGLSVIDGITSARSSVACEFTNNISKVNSEENGLPRVDLNTKNKCNMKLGSLETITPMKELNNINNVPLNTPVNSEYIVKTNEVTPMLDYATLSTPDRNKELDKYGLKPLKRKRAIQLLTHLYNQTHPFVEDCEDLPSPSKRQKQSSIQPRKIIATTTKSPRKFGKSPRQSPRKMSSPPQNCYPEKYSENAVESSNLATHEGKENIYEITTQKPVIKDLGCNEDDWVFQKREKAKLHSCRVPLHIAFHNYVSCRRGLLEAILRYEPVNIDAIHKGLLGDGYRFDPKDLLKFLDRKCITVKTDNKNKKHY